jgi:hypothetical protein
MTALVAFEVIKITDTVSSPEFKLSSVTLPNDLGANFSVLSAPDLATTSGTHPCAAAISSTDSTPAFDELMFHVPMRNTLFERIPSIRGQDPNTILRIQRNKSLLISREGSKFLIGIR